MLMNSLSYKVILVYISTSWYYVSGICLVICSPDGDILYPSDGGIEILAAEVERTARHGYRFAHHFHIFVDLEIVFIFDFTCILLFRLVDFVVVSLAGSFTT